MTQLTHTPLTNIELCYDGVHTPLTRTPIADLPKDSDGEWSNYTYDSHGNVLTYENSNGVWFNYTYDSNINALAYENSRGDWYKHTRDSNGNILTYDNSYHKWFKYTRDPEGNLLTYEDKDGLITYIAGDSQHGLYYEDGLYIAGCRRFSYDQAVVHWSKRAQEDYAVIKARAIKFLAAVHKHHKGSIT